MRIDSGSGNQVLNGPLPSTRLILMVRVILCFTRQSVSHSRYSQEERSRDGKTRSLGSVSRIYWMAIGEIMTRSHLKVVWMLETLFMADRISPASSEHSKDGLLWGDFIDAMIPFECWILLTDDSIKWDRANPRHSSCLPWRSAHECIRHSEAVFQPNSAF